jgi:outer membrane protein
MSPRTLLLLAFVFPAVAAAETVRLTADESSRRLVEVSHVAAAATERAAAAASATRAADAAALPSLFLTASAVERSSVDEYRLPIPVPGVEAPVLVPNITEVYGAVARAQQALYAGGAITAQKRAARSEEAATLARKDLASLDLRLLGRSAYWQAVGARAALEVAKSQETRTTRLVADITDTFEAGLAVKADVLAARERAARARTQVVRSEVSSENALAELRSLLALPASDEVELADSLASPLPTLPDAVDTLRLEALGRRPETLVLAAQLAALRQQESLAASAGKPLLVASAQYDWSNPNLRYFPQTDEWKGAWAVAIGASWSVFDGGKWRADVATSRALQRSLAEELEELRRRVGLEVETAARELAGALEAVASTEAAWAAAAENEKAAQERLEAGVAAILEVLDAQSQLAGAERERVQARASAWLAAARLDRAVGR